MQARTFGLVEHRGKERLVHVFGHRSHGLPGIQFTGAGRALDVFREKLLFLVKERGLRIPLRRYSLAIDPPDPVRGSLAKEGGLEQLELPLFVLFLQLSENIRINRLDRCVSSGSIGIDGGIRSREPAQGALRGAGGVPLRLLTLEPPREGAAQISLQHVHPRLFGGDGGRGAGRETP